MKGLRVKKQVWIVLILVLCICLFSLINFKGDTAEGVAYIKAQESIKTDKLKKKMVKKKKVELMEAVENGKVDVFSLFYDYVLLGDSRVKGYTTYQFLQASNCLSGSGYSILDVDKFLDQIKLIKPSRVYLSFGVNDMGFKLDNTDEGSYGQLYEKQVNKILEIVPNADIYVNSIIPVTPETLVKTPNWSYC